MWYCDILLASTIFLLLKHVANLESEFKSSNRTDNIVVNRSCLNLGASRKVSLLFHPETNDCYAKESKGPCGEKMKLYSVDGEIGEYDCDSTSRMLIYFKEENQCFPIFQRGPCKSGKWTDVTQEGMPTCVQNPCYRNSVNNEEEDLVMFNGTCVEVGATSVCGQGFQREE